MTAAAVGDRFGRRRVFAAGLGVFAAGSAACALAPGAGALIAARAVQGVGAAMVMPLALALLNAAFPPQRRGWAMGIFGGVTGLAVVVGPVLGGAITQGITWQCIFWLNVPIALAGIPLVLRRLAESYGPRAALDLPGLGLVTGAALGLVWGLVRGSSAGWASPEVIGALAAARCWPSCSLPGSACPSPMLPMRLFAFRGFSAGNAAIFLLNASLTGVVFFTAQFLQVVSARTPSAPVCGCCPGASRRSWSARGRGLADRIGERPLVVAGLLLLAAGLAWIAVVAVPGPAYPAMSRPWPSPAPGWRRHARLTKAVSAGCRPATSAKPRGRSPRCVSWRGLRGRDPRRRVRPDRQLLLPRLLQRRLLARRRGRGRPGPRRGARGTAGPARTAHPGRASAGRRGADAAPGDGQPVRRHGPARAIPPPDRAVAGDGRPHPAGSHGEADRPPGPRSWRSRSTGSHRAGRPSAGGRASLARRAGTALGGRGMGGWPIPGPRRAGWGRGARMAGQPGPGGSAGSGRPGHGARRSPPTAPSPCGPGGARRRRSPLARTRA